MAGYIAELGKAIAADDLAFVLYYISCILGEEGSVNEPRERSTSPVVDQSRLTRPIQPSIQDSTLCKSL